MNRNLNSLVVLCFAVLTLVISAVLDQTAGTGFGWFLLLSTMLALLTAYSAGGDAR